MKESMKDRRKEARKNGREGGYPKSSEDKRPSPDRSYLGGVEGGDEVPGKAIMIYPVQPTCPAQPPCPVPLEELANPEVGGEVIRGVVHRRCQCNSRVFTDLEDGRAEGRTEGRTGRQGGKERRGETKGRKNAQFQNRQDEQFQDEQLQGDGEREGNEGNEGRGERNDMSEGQTIS
jgi:hypothetical protein